MPRELKLNCLILDDNNDNHTFSVRITDEDTNVDDLKNKIREEKQVAFRDISADTLDLWNVSIPDDKVSRTKYLCDLPLKQGPLRGVNKLFNLFPDTPQNDHLHIIVKPPHIAVPPSPQSLLVLNCLVLGESSDHIFEVKIAKTESASSLREVIKGERDRLFNRVDADDLILWNVSEVADLNLKKPLQKANFSRKESLSPMEKLSKIFSNTLVEGRLHIVVGLAEYADVIMSPGPPRKRVREEEEAPENFTQRASVSIIYDRAWGKKWPQHEDTILKSQIGDVDESHDGYAYPGSDIPDHLTYVCLDQMGGVAEHLRLNQIHEDFVVVREEYRWLCERLEIDETECVVITGQPGIGKTAFLLYLLLYRLERMLPTAIQLSPEFFFIFDKHGALACNSDVYDKGRLKKCSALSDSNSQIGQPCNAFLRDARRIIQVASPEPVRWRQWMKEKGASRIVSELPKVLEIAAVLKESKHDTSLTLPAVSKWGPSIRTIAQIIKKPTHAAQFECDAREAARDICNNPSIAFRMFGPEELSSEGSTVLFTRPHRVPSHTNTSMASSVAGVLFIPTKFLTSVFDEFCDQLTTQVSLNLFTAFSSHSLTGSPGWSHEYNMHQRMCNGGPPLRIFGSSGTMNLQPASSLLPGTSFTLKCQTASGPSTFYWIPSVINFPGIDSVLGAGKDIFILQASVSVSEKYRSPIDGIRKTWNAVSPIVQENCTWRVVIVSDTHVVADCIRKQLSVDLKGLRLGRRTGVGLRP